MALASGEPEFGIYFCAPVKFVAVIQLTDIFDRRIIPRLAERHSRGVAQPGSATALGAVGREFESLHPDQF